MKHLSNNDFNDNPLVNVPDGFTPQDAVNKRQLDDKVSGTIRVTTAATAPSSPGDGDLWLDTTDTEYPLADYLEKTNNLSDLMSAAAARGNLGLGALSVRDYLQMQHSAAVRLTSTQTTTAATYTTVVFNSEMFDIGSNYNTATGEFTAPIDGYYRVNAHMMVNNPAAGAVIIGRIQIDGSVAAQDKMPVPATGEELTVNLDRTFYLTQGEKVTLAIYISGATNQVFGDGSGSYTWAEFLFQGVS